MKASLSFYFCFLLYFISFSYVANESNGPQSSLLPFQLYTTADSVRHTSIDAAQNLLKKNVFIAYIVTPNGHM